MLLNVTHEHFSAQAQASIHLFYDLTEIHFVLTSFVHSSQSTSFRGGFLWSFFFFSSFIYPYSCMFVLYMYALCIEFSEKENDCEKRKRRINTHIQVRCAMLAGRNMWVGHIHDVTHLWQFPVSFSQLELFFLFSTSTSLLLAINQPDRNILPKHSGMTMKRIQFQRFQKTCICQSK